MTVSHDERFWFGVLRTAADLGAGVSVAAIIVVYVLLDGFESELTVKPVDCHLDIIEASPARSIR